MRPRFTLALLLLSAAVTTPQAWSLESAAPEPAPLDRYEKTLDLSPFALATKVEAPMAPQDSFTANWMLTGLTQLPDESGALRNFITVRSRDQRLSFSLYGEEPSVSEDPDVTGVAISRVELSSDDSHKSVVYLKKGGQEGKVEFSQETATPAMPSPPPGGGGAKPAYSGAGAPTVPAQGKPPSPGARPSLPRPMSGQFVPPGGSANQGQAKPAVNTGGPGSMPGAGTPTTTTGRRVRLIQTR